MHPRFSWTLPLNCFFSKEWAGCSTINFMMCELEHFQQGLCIWWRWLAPSRWMLYLLPRSLPLDIHASGSHERHRLPQLPYSFSLMGVSSGHAVSLGMFWSGQPWSMCAVSIGVVSQGHICVCPILILFWRCVLMPLCSVRSRNRITWSANAV